MARRTIRRSIEEANTVKVSAAEVVAMLKAAGHVPEHVDAFGVDFTFDAEDGGIIKWVETRSETEARGE